MKVKVIFGYVFIAVAILILLGLISKFTDFISGIAGIFSLVGADSAYDAGYVAGQFVFWVLHVLVIIALITIGRNWIRKRATTRSASSD